MNLSSEPETLRESLPDVTSTRHLAGLSAPVDVFRDRWGIPHIRAGSTTDLFFGQGFATAQDRLWQMEMYRRAAEGRWTCNLSRWCFRSTAPSPSTETGQGPKTD